MQKVCQSQNSIDQWVMLKTSVPGKKRDGKDIVNTGIAVRTRHYFTIRFIGGITVQANSPSFNFSFPAAQNSAGQNKLNQYNPGTNKHKPRRLP